MKRGIWFTVVAVSAMVLWAAAADACPTCKDGLAAADSQGANIARGYFYSILLMLAMPFTLAGSFGLYVWREFRRQEAAGSREDRQAAGHDRGAASDDQVSLGLHQVAR